jgi:hypothetical protein
MPAEIPPTDSREFPAYCASRGDRCDRTEAEQAEIVGKLRALALDLSSLGADVRQIGRRFEELNGKVSGMLLILAPHPGGADGH